MVVDIHVADVEGILRGGGGGAAEDIPEAVDSEIGNLNRFDHQEKPI